MVLVHVLAIAQKILETVHRLNIRHDASEVASTITLSIGTATRQPKEGDTLEKLVAAADDALYRAKEAGRTRIVCADIFHDVVE